VSRVWSPSFLSKAPHKTPRRRSTINHPRRRPKSFTRPRLCCCAWPSRRAAVRSEHARGLGTDEPAAAPASARAAAERCQPVRTPRPTPRQLLTFALGQGAFNRLPHRSRICVGFENIVMLLAGRVRQERSGSKCPRNCSR
jgi:hypothetical protein